MTATAPEPTGPAGQAPESDDGNRTLYWIIGGVAILLAILGLITYSGKKEDQQAEQKAAQLSQSLQRAGLKPPDQDILVRSLGSDGGAVCDNPATALGRATLFDQMTNGADFVGRRPIIVDSRILVGEALILQTYCPEKLQQFRDKTQDLKTDDVIKN
jgi:hypothetical protein